MKLWMHPNYQRTQELAQLSHQQNRNPAGIDGQAVTLARLYSYAFRQHVIGTFHATKAALAEYEPAGSLAGAHRRRAVESLEDLISQAMEPVPHDFRAVITTFWRYHNGITRVLDSLSAEVFETSSTLVGDLAERFRTIITLITSGCGIHLTQDTEAPAQSGFVVPGLGITIVPLVYGDQHSWNLAWLAGDERNVPTHRHYHGVEIHLGYNPTRGMTVLGPYRAKVDEGYAMPIPPETDHGWVNTSSQIHHVPFLFGSLQHGGWGVFLDVEAQPGPVSDLREVPRDSEPFANMVYLERELDEAARLSSTTRKTLIPYTATHRGDAGGLELSVTTISHDGARLPMGEFRTVSVARGRGLVAINGIERDIRAHDHFGVPAGMTCELRKTGNEPLVVLDAIITRTGQ